MTFPWMQSKYTDKAVVCAICGQWISVGEPRKYNQQSKLNAHDACVGAKVMGDHMSASPVQPDVAMRSCWECNPAHEHLKNATGRFVCFECGRYYENGAFLTSKASPERESREAAIERMHGENVDAAKAIADAVRSLKATCIETNMLLSVFVEAYAKRPPEGPT